MSTMEGQKTVSGPRKKHFMLSTGNLIRYWRKRRQGKPQTSLSQIELAKLASISPAALRRYESGKALPPTKTLFLLAASLDLPPHVLLAPLWRKAREEVSQKRKALGFAKPVPQTWK